MISGEAWEHAPWARSGDDAPARRLNLNELSAELAQAGFREIEVVYRFRDRVVIVARHAR